MLTIITSLVVIAGVYIIIERIKRRSLSESHYLSSGIETRLRPMTENTLKALSEANQKPLIEYQIEF